MRNPGFTVVFQGSMVILPCVLRLFSCGKNMCVYHIFPRGKNVFCHVFFLGGDAFTTFYTKTRILLMFFSPRFFLIKLQAPFAGVGGAGFGF